MIGRDANIMSVLQMTGALVVDVLVQHVPEIIGESTFTTPAQAAAQVVKMNRHTLTWDQRAEPLDPRDPLFNIVHRSTDDTISNILSILRLGVYDAAIAGLIDIAQSRVRLARQATRAVPDVAAVSTMHDSDLVKRCRSLDIFPSKDVDLSTVRRLLVDHMRERQSSSLQLQRLSIRPDMKDEDVALSVRRSVAAARTRKGSHIEAVDALATLVAVTRHISVRTGIYVHIMNLLRTGQRLPPGLPRQIDACARHMVHTEFLRRKCECSSGCGSRVGRVFVTDDVAIDIHTSVRQERDEDGFFTKDTKLRESRMLGVPNHEFIQAQVCMVICDTDRFLHVERCGDASTETWIPREDASSFLERLRICVSRMILGHCTVVKGALKRDIRGHRCGDAECACLNGHVLGETKVIALDGRTLLRQRHAGPDHGHA